MLSQTPLTDEAFAAVRAWQSEPPWHQVASIQNNKAAWEAEVVLVSTTPSLIAQILAREISPCDENDTAIATILDRVQLLAGHFALTKQLIAALVSGYLKSRPVARREIVLRAITANRSELSMRGDWLTSTVRTYDFPPEFLRAWFLELIPTDGTGGGFWSVIDVFAVAKSENALMVAASPGLEQTTVGRQLRVRLLGALRFNPTIPAAAKSRLATIVESLASHLDPNQRIDYLRTFDLPLWRGDVPTSELTDLLAKLDAATPAEQAIGFEIANATVSGSAPREQQITIFGWLRQHTTPLCTPEQKFQVAGAIWRCWKSFTEAELGFDLMDLLVAIQPVDTAQAGVWRNLEHTLQEMLHADPKRFRQTVRTLARLHWRPLREALSERNAMSWLLDELRQAPFVTDFVGELSASVEAGERRLGAHLFEAFSLAPSTDHLPNFTAESFQLWLAEFRTRNVYNTVAAQLVDAAKRVDVKDPLMVEKFQSEAYYQCLNLPGLCLEKIREHVQALPMLHDVVASADAYFAKLHSLRDSAIKAQLIPGLRRFQFRKAQADRRRMDEQIEQGSLFAQLVSKSYLLYGNRHSYLMEGNLTAPAELQGISTSFEMPRMEGIDPEEAQMRRLGALATLSELRRRTGKEPSAPL